MPQQLHVRYAISLIIDGISRQTEPVSVKSVWQNSNPFSAGSRARAYQVFPNCAGDLANEATTATSRNEVSLGCAAACLNIVQVLSYLNQLFSALFHTRELSVRHLCSAVGHWTVPCCTAPEQSPTLQHPGPDISRLKVELQKQWHHTKNLHLGDQIIWPSSRLSVWWTCNNCPCGQPHEWTARVDTRQNMNSQCPFCTNNKLCKHNSLSTVAPTVAAYWDEARNNMTADQIVALSSSRKHWLCPKCGHNWQSPVRSKVRHGTGCPRCSVHHSTRTKRPSLTESNHPVMAEFHFARNRAFGLDPDKISCGSHRQVHWICRKCPKGQLHLFDSSPNHRIGKNTGCPYCTSKKVCTCNLLQSLHPALAEEWDHAKNDVGPDQVFARTHKIACWKDASGYTWEQSPYDRTHDNCLRSKRARIKAKKGQV